MAARKQPLTDEEIAAAFRGPNGESVAPIILSPAGLATILNVSPKTIYEWISQGRLDGCFRKRGKHVLIWRDRAIKSLFNGRDWIK